jgi:hypothetical protein
VLNPEKWAGHTPGPWYWATVGSQRTLTDKGERKKILRTSIDEDIEADDANEELISAAPDLAEAVVRLQGEVAALKDECEQRRRAQRSAAEWLERKSRELATSLPASKNLLAVALGMLARSIGQDPLPKDVRERMAIDRRRATENT